MSSPLKDTAPDGGLSPASWIAVQNLLTQAFGLLLFAIQAPLLGPRAFGLITIVMVFIGFCEYVLEVASTDALISVRHIEVEHYSTMTTANGAFALGLGALVFLCAHSIAHWFQEPELEPILRWMAVLPLVSALASAPNAASRRELQFKPLALRTLISTAAGGIVGLALTFAHFGVWALVWQAIVQRVLNVTILWRLVAVPFQLKFSAPHFRELWRYAGPMLLSQTMSWSATQIPRFILGLYLGAAELGLFSLGSRIHDIVVQLTLSPTYGVARVKMREYADDRVGLNAAVTSLLKKMALLCFPLCIGGAAVMPVLFHVWLDARWSAGVLAAQLLLLGAMPYVAHYALSAALLAMNRQSSIAVNSTVQSIATVIVTALFAPLGLNPAAASIALRPMATVTFPVVFAHRHCGIPPRLVLQAQVPIFIAASVMGAVVWALAWALQSVWNPVFLLGALVVTGVVVYALMLGMLQPGLLATSWARLPFTRRKGSQLPSS